MKNSVILALVAVSTLLASCNKGGSDIRVKKIVTGKGTTEFTYSPDNKILSTKNSDSTKADFTFNGNTITQHASDMAHGQSMNSTMHIGAGGYVDTTSASDPTGSYMKLDTHDAEGNIINTKEFMSGALRRSTTSVFKEGNEVSRTISDATGQPVVTIFFDYYTDKTNTLAAENFGMKFMGKDSKNLMKKYVQVLAKGDTVGSGTFSYKFDDKSRVIAKSTYDAKGMMADSANVTYY